MPKTGYLLYSFATYEEDGLRSGETHSASWDYGRLNHLPLWVEFTNFETWTNYGRKFPYSFCYTLEVPIQGDLLITRHGETTVVRPGNVYLLPTGDGGAVKAAKCWKFSIGICGELVEQFVISSRLIEKGSLIPLGDTARMYQYGETAFHLLRTKDPDSVPQVAGLTSEILTFLREQQPDSLPPEIANALRIFECRLPLHISISDVARELGISSRTLSGRFHAALGQSPKQYLIELRMKTAERLLARTELDVGDVASRTGYSSAFGFCREFTKKHGIPPSEWRIRNR